MNLGLEVLERRTLLSALAANDPNAGGPPAQSGVYTTGNNFAPGSPTSSLGTIAPVPGAPEQSAQTFLTVSPLYSGTQGPALAYLGVMPALSAPNQPLPYGSPLVQLPTFILPSAPVITARPLRLGGTGGDTSLVGPLSSSVFDNDIEEDWSLFGNREPEGPTGEVPSKELIDQLSELGEMDNLLFGDPAPATRQESTDEGDLKDEDVKTDAGDQGVKSEPSDNDGAAIPNAIDEEVPHVAHVSVPTVRAEDQTVDRGVATQTRQTEQSRAAIGLAVGWVLASGEFGITPADRLERFQRRQRN